jgi:hypothetical protein
MLPFLKHKKEASVSMPAETIVRDSDHEEHGDEIDALHVAAEDLMHAIHSKSVAAIAEALKAAFDICDALPHVEGEHIEQGEE